MTPALPLHLTSSPEPSMRDDTMHCALRTTHCPLLTARCSLLTRYIAKRFPEAEVTGITISAEQQRTPHRQARTHTDRMARTSRQRRPRQALLLGPATHILTRECVCSSPWTGRATALATERGIPNAKFELVDALNMSYPDNSFDLVWGCESGEHMPSNPTPNPTPTPNPKPKPNPAPNPNPNPNPNSNPTPKSSPSPEPTQASTCPTRRSTCRRWRACSSREAASSSRPGASAT